MQLKPHIAKRKPVCVEMADGISASRQRTTTKLREIQSRSRSLVLTFRFRFLICVFVSCVFAEPALAQTSRAAISALIRQNRIEDAEAKLWSALRSDPDQVWALDLMASVRMRQNRAQEAEALFRKATNLNARDVEGWRGLGDACNALGNTDDAIDAYSRVVAITPADFRANTALARIFQQGGKYKESVLAVERIPVAMRNPQLLALLARDYFALSEPGKVSPLIKSLLRRGNSDIAGIGDFVTVLLSSGYIDDAAHIVEIIKPTHPSAPYLQILGRIRAAQGRLPEARVLLMQALKLEPKSFDLLFDSARLAAQADDWPDVVDFLRRADQVKRDQPEVLQKLGLSLLKTGNNQGALAIARRMNFVVPNNPDNQYFLAATLIENNLPEDAEPIARKIAEARPQDVNSVLLLAVAEFKKGDFTAARQDLNRCLGMDPHSADGHYYSALLFQRDGNLEAASSDLEEVIRINPKHVAALQMLGIVSLQLGQLERARSVLEMAVKIAPASSQSHYQLALAYGRLSMRDRAHQEMETYQNLRHADDEAHKRQQERPANLHENVVSR